jgi:hypothetical protein
MRPPPSTIGCEYQGVGCKAVAHNDGAAMRRRGTFPTLDAARFRGRRLNTGF